MTTRFAYIGTAVLMAVAALIGLSKTWDRRLRHVLFGLAVAGLLLFFGTHLWIYATERQQGLPTGLPTLLSGTILQIDSLLIPLIIVAAVLLVDFSRSVAEGVTGGLWTLPALAARVVLAVVLGVKLLVQALPLQDLTDYLTRRPGAAARVVLSLVFFGGVAYLVRRWPARPQAADEAKEPVIYGAALVGSIPVLVNLVVLLGAELALGLFGNLRFGAAVLRSWPFFAVGDYGEILVWGVAGIAGLYLVLRRGGSDVAREGGLALILIAAWTWPFLVLENVFDTIIGFRQPLFDVLVTLGVAVYLVVRWRRISAARAVFLTAMVVFSWLVFVKGDFISILGGFIGLPGIIVVVFATIFALLADSGFASRDSRHLPRAARALLWVGYLLLSVTLLLWYETAHLQNPTTAHGDIGFFFIGIPLAVWLLLRRPFAPPAPEEGPPEAATEEPAREVTA